MILMDLLCVGLPIKIVIIRIILCCKNTLIAYKVNCLLWKF